jgi:chemotaxis protein MotB
MMSRPQGRAGHDRWLVSYADLVTLLLALFTTLYAASTLDSHKLTPVAVSLREAFDARPVPTVASEKARPALVPPVEIVSRQAAFDGLKSRLSRELSDAIQAQRLEITTDGRGLVISLPENATFPIGTADVTPEARALIARVATTIATLPNLVRVEGHTDDTPIRTARYASNWELSTARASAVVAYLIESEGIDPARLSAAGYGEFHPRAPNTSAESRARNRRIDLVVLDASAPSTAASLAYAARQIPDPKAQSPNPNGAAQ